MTNNDEKPTREVRRKDRATELDDAEDILTRGLWGTLSMVDGTEPYGVPISYTYEDGAIFVHSAPEGRKLDCIARQPRVSFSVVTRAETLASRFSVDYASAIATGFAEELFDDAKLKALGALITKYSPDFEAEGAAYIAAAASKTRVFKITIETLTGKARR